MIVVAMSNPKHILGGSAEERELYGKALCGHYGRQIVWVEPLQGARYHVTFAEALADMHTAQAMVAEAMYQGADSVWDFAVSES